MGDGCNERKSGAIRDAEDRLCYTLSRRTKEIINWGPYFDETEQYIELLIKMGLNGEGSLHTEVNDADEKLSEEYLEENIEVINFGFSPSVYRQYSEGFLDRNMEDVGRYNVSRLQNMSFSFIEKNIDRLNIDGLQENTAIEEKAKEYVSKIAMLRKRFQ